MRHLLATATLAFLSACATVPTRPGLTTRQVAVLQENGFVATDGRWELGLPDRLLFASEESALVASQNQRLDRMARALAGVGIRGARVEGNTDSIGASTYNQALSERRATAVRAVLVTGGMDGAAIAAIGRGEHDPIESNRTASGRQENRRVVIIITAADAR